jgi:8-oxo-dGTP pyrophosphatase MutT (NUDIX family)
MSNNNYRPGVVILLENQQGELAMQLRDDARWYKHWGLFGGWLEPDEEPSIGIQREILEELEVILQPDKLTFKGVHELDEFSATCIVFHYPVQNEMDKAVLHEGLEWRFMSLAEIFNALVVTHQLSMLHHYYG